MNLQQLITKNVFGYSCTVRFSSCIKHIQKRVSFFCGQINLIAPPRYVMTTTTLERTEGLSMLNQAMAVIKEKIEEKRGVFNVQMEVSVLYIADIKLSYFIYFTGSM